MKDKLTIIDFMKEIYNTQYKDWMGFKITKENPLTYHHIIKEEDGGNKTLDNGALLTKLAHSYLHMIEIYDESLYIMLNTILKRINDSKTKPTKDDYYEIINIFEIFEEKYNKELCKNIKMKKYNYQALKRVSRGKYSLYSPTNIRNVMMEGINPVTIKYQKCKVRKK